MLGDESRTKRHRTNRHRCNHRSRRRCMPNGPTF
ncbi:unnamed protein product [Brassica rapa subsp. narinosa]